MAKRKIPGLALVLKALCLVFWLTSALLAEADPYPPTLSNNAAHFPAVSWPNEPANAADCGLSCGDWLPYTRFQNAVADPRTQDPSNGGTSPQNYVNISSSCTDKSLPSIYYALRQGAANDGSDDVILFRWRVEQIANTYATGPSAGNYGATDPWNSALWSVLFDVNGDGFLDLAAHLDGSSGAPAASVDRIAGIWSTLPTQSLDYLGDPTHVKLLAHNPTAYVDPTSKQILNFRNALSPLASWPNGSAETNWDYGTTRSRLVSTSPCNEYFIDYQIPVKMLDASSLGGPKITRSSPISMVFCTANSLNNPFQKDCAINAGWMGAAGQPAPFGDYISFNQSAPYAQPIVASVSATPPNSCPGAYTLSAEVQDTLAVVNGKVVPSVKAVKFYFYYDANGDGLANDGGSWTFAADGSRTAGSYTHWSGSWSGTGLPKGSYLIGVQAVDDNSLVDLGVTPSGVDNRTFSYVTGDAANRIYVGATAFATLPAHVPAQSPSSAENWYGNPAVTGSQVALVGLALNTCGVAPTLTKSASVSNLAAGGSLTYTLTLGNSTGSAITVSQLSDALPAGFSYLSTGPVSNGASPVTPATQPTANATGTVVWGFNNLSIANNSALTLSFAAQAAGTAGTYNNVAAASTSFGSLSSDPVAVQVDSARLSLSKTPGSYSVNPGGSLSYTLSYSNDSAVSVSNASISDTLPAGLSFVSCSGGSACANNAGVVSWTLGNLAGGASGSVTLNVSLSAGYSSSSLANTATLSATAPDNTPLNKQASATVAVNVPQPAFTLSKTASSALNAYQVAPSGTVTWTLAYKNYGTGAASGVVITDPLPAGFTFSSCAFTGGTPSGGSCSQSNGVVTWNWGSATVAAGASGSVTVVATAAAAPFTYPNPAVNTATLTWSGNATGVSASNTLGVTGQSCSAVYYFHGPTSNRAATLTPPASSDTTISEQPGTTTLVFPGTAPAGGLNVAGKTLTISFYMASSTGNAKFNVVLYNVSTGTTIADSGVVGVSNSSGVAVLQNFTAVIPASGVSISAGDVLQWKFTLSGSGQLPTFFYNSQADNSRSSICDTTSPASLTLSKTVDQPHLDSSALPATLQYTLTFANTGGTAASGATVVDTLPANTSFVSATLNGTAITPTQSGQQLTFSNVKAVNESVAGQVAAGTSGSIVIQATASSAASGTLVNNASFSATGLSAVQASASTGVGSAAAGSPSLSLSKAASKTLLTAGDSVTYTLTLVNTGTGAASNVTVQDVLPVMPYYSPGTCTTATGSCGLSAGTVSWTVPSLAAGASATLSIPMQVAASGVPAGLTALDNQATASDAVYCTGSPRPAGCTSNTVTVSISGNPNLSLSKSVSPATVLPGGQVSYTLTVSNSGSAAATGLVITDPIPSHLSFKAITGSGSGTGSFDAVNNRVVYTLGSLAAGASSSLSFTATVGSLASGTTTLTNTASASASNAPSRTAVASNSATVAPSMTLSKSGPASLPFPAATLSAAADGSSANVFVHSASLLSVGDWVQVLNGADNPLVQVSAISGPVLSLSSPVTAPSGAALRLAGMWSLSYQNTGTADAAAVQISDPLPGSWLYVASSPAASSAPTVGQNGTLSWSIGSVPVGGSGTVQLWAVPTATGSSVNTATLSATGLTDVSSSASLVTGGLVLSKVTTTPTRSAGSLAHYVVTVSNSLNQAVSGFSITDALPTGFSYVAGSTLVNGSPAADPGFNVSDTVGNQPTWSALSVPALGSLSLAFDALIDASVGAATYQNAVSLGNMPVGIAAQPFDPLSTTAEDVTVLAAGTGVVQGHVFRDANGNGSFDAGTDPIYTGVAVSLTVGGSTYTTATDGNGFFSRVLPAGSVQVSVNQADLPAGLSLATGNLNPGTVTLAAGGISQKDTGYVLSVPVLAVSKSHSGSFVAGGSGSYSVSVSNSGGASTTGTVSLSDSAPSGMTVTAMSGTGWTCTSLPTCTRGDALAPGASYPAITVSVSVADGASSPLINSVSVSGGGSASASASDSTVISGAPAWQISKSHSGNFVAGGTGSYSVTVKNNGGSATAASTVTVTDAPPTGMTLTGMSGTNWSCANSGGWRCTRSDALAAGASYEAITVSVAIAANAGTPLVNSATVTGGGVASDATASDSTVIVPPAALAIAKQAPASVLAGGAITYTITLSNLGGSPSGTTATVKDALPPGMSVTAVTPGSGVNTVDCGTLPQTSVFNCSVTFSSALAVNGTASFSYTASAPATAGTVTNYIAVDPTGGSSPAADPSQPCTPSTACASASTTVNGPDVYTRLVAPASVTQGAVVNLIVTFGNQGTVSAQGVSYQLSLPSTASSVSCGGVVCSFNAVSGVLTLGSLPTTLVAGQQLTVLINYRAPLNSTADLNAASLIDTTTPGESPTNNNSARAVTMVSASPAQADPTTTVRAPASAYAGATVAADLGYTNLGAVNAEGLALAVTGFPATGTPLLSYNGVACIWSAATGAVSGCGLPSTLPAGQSITLRASYIAPAPGVVTLRSSVSASVDSNPDNNSATASTTVAAPAQSPLVDATVSVSLPAQAYGGSTVLATLVYQNLGPGTAAGIGYGLTLPPGLAGVQPSHDGVACGFDGQAVTGCNLPASLAAGQTVTVQLAFTAPPAPASVRVDASVSSASTESDLGNNSASASLQVPALQPSGTISGRVWYDVNRNRRFDAGEVGRAHWSIDLLQAGTPIARTTTDASGLYSFTGLADGVYAVRFMPWIGSGVLPVNGENGSAIIGGGTPGQSILDNIVVANTSSRNFQLKIGSDVVTEQSLPLDPSGTVYDSVTRQPLAGASVTLGYSCGPLDPSWLIPAGASTVSTGADGAYAFFLQASAPTGCNYTLSVSKGGYTSPSQTIAPSGQWPVQGGPVSPVTGAPGGSQPTTYYLSGPKPELDLSNNNIPLDPLVPVAKAPAPIPALSAGLMAWLGLTLVVLAAPALARRGACVR